MPLRSRNYITETTGCLRTEMCNSVWIYLVGTAADRPFGVISSVRAIMMSQLSPFQTPRLIQGFFPKAPVQKSEGTVKLHKTS